ncbi:DUF2059 domain-containing protein [Undibacterium sp. WLHG33]|uniref:DUF2059 domain-containing protein n=1 Tax=Undibacterium sp. WLHG33 TaxID=3412482 RepID=UPI003C2BC97B
MKLRHTVTFSLLFSLLLSVAHAQTAKPTDASIRELLLATQSKELLQSVQSQTDNMTATIMRDAAYGTKVDEEKQKALDKFRDKIIAIQKEELSWEKMEPMLINIYASSLTQEDVDGITAFYKSPAGKAYVQKIPAIMQQTMTQMQAKLKPMAEKIKQAQKELNEEFASIDKKKKSLK